MIIVTERPFRELVRRLREFEGGRCLWRLPVAALLKVLPWALLLAVFVVSAYAAGDLSSFLRVVAAGVVTVALAPVVEKLRRRRLWRSIVADRLWTYEKPNVRSDVPLMVRQCDVEQVQLALRKVHINPGIANITGSVPPDAPDLTCRMGVQEPEQWAVSRSDLERVERVASVIDRAGLRARVAGRDVGIDRE